MRVSPPFKQRGNINLMNLFRKAPVPTTTQQAGPAAPNNQQQQQGGPQGPNNASNVDPNNPTNKSKDNPLDIFKGMFDNTGAAGAEDKAPSFSLDPEKLKTLVGTMDFSSQITPEALASLKSDDPNAVKATLNSLGQQVYATLMQHIPALTENFVTARQAHDQKNLGRSVKSTMTKQSLDKLAADNPVLRRQLDTVGEQLLSQFPDATPEWIAEQTPRYFVEIAKMLAPDQFVKEPSKDGTPAQPPADNFDWSKWMSGSAQAKQ